MTRQDEPPRDLANPMPGYFKIKRVKGGPWVAAVIDHGMLGWRCSINGQGSGFPNPNPFEVTDLARVYEYGVRIGAAEYLDLLRNPHPNPDKPVDMNAERPPSF
jgi:hypothetical protein